MKYDPILCMNVLDGVRTKDESVKLETSYNLIKKSAEEYERSRNNKMANPQAVKLKKDDLKHWIGFYESSGGKRDVSKYKSMLDSKTIDKAIRNCDYAYGTAEIKDANGKWIVFHGGKYVQEFDNSDDAEAFVREKGWH